MVRRYLQSIQTLKFHFAIKEIFLQLVGQIQQIIENNLVILRSN